MIDDKKELTPYKFNLNDRAWVTLGNGQTLYCRVWGREDGRNLLPKYNGWVYWVRVYGVDGGSFDQVVTEDHLDSPNSEIARYG